MIPAVAGRIPVGLALYLILSKWGAFKPRPLISFIALAALGLAGFGLLRLTTS